MRPPAAIVLRLVHRRPSSSELVNRKLIADEKPAADRRPPDRPPIPAGNPPSTFSVLARNTRYSSQPVIPAAFRALRSPIARFARFRPLPARAFCPETRALARSILTKLVETDRRNQRMLDLTRPPTIRSLRSHPLASARLLLASRLLPVPPNTRSRAFNPKKTNRRIRKRAIQHSAADRFVRFVHSVRTPPTRPAADHRLAVAFCSTPAVALV